MLNEAQQRAVETIEGPVLIIAGAGAGKTRVITHRILNLVKRGVDPRSILAITFTNKAAREMKERVQGLLAEDRTLNLPISAQERPFVSTFHALGVYLIRENAGLLGLTRHFMIYDRSDSRRTIKEAMLQASVDPKTFEPGTILNAISRAKGDGTGRIAYADAARDHFEELIGRVWEKYEAILTEERALDFDDLLFRAVQLLERHVEVRKRYQAIWRYIHVDEYQDTNRVQYELVRLLAEQSPHNICVVGDADQNIYSWRGATIENILNFEKDYPEATVITLEKNYRSTKTILLAANAVIEKNKLRRKKVLYTDNASGEKISLLVSYSETEEAHAIASAVRSAIGEGVPAREIAVLYRANFQSRALEEAFIKKNIPYQLLGTKFFERKEVKDVLAYIRAALNTELETGSEERGKEVTNPDPRASKSKLRSQNWGDVGRVINVPPRGIGKVTVAKIMSGQENSLPDAMQGKVADFWKLLSDIRREILTKKPSEAVKFVIQESGLERQLREGDGEDEERLLNVRELVSVAAQYDDMDGTAGIESLLENAALASDQDDLVKNADAVKLMTVHASKGLEFEIVFIAGLEQDLFPFKHMDDEDVSPHEEEEERRLFYVALTRAKKKLYLSYSIIRTVYGAQRVNAPSEFLSDIEKDLLEERVPEKPTGAKAIFIDF